MVLCSQCAEISEWKFVRGGWENGSVGGCDSTNHSTDRFQDWVLNMCLVSTVCASSHLTIMKLLRSRLSPSFCWWRNWALEMTWTAYKSLSTWQYRHSNSWLLPSEAQPPRHWLCAWANPTVPTWTLVPRSSAFQPHTLCPFLNTCQLEIPVPRPVPQAAEMPCCVLVIKALVALSYSQWSRCPGAHSVEMGGRRTSGWWWAHPHACLRAGVQSSHEQLFFISLCTSCSSWRASA